MSHRCRSTRQIFAWPALIAVLSTAGLFAALLDDGLWDSLALLGLGLSAALGVSGFWRRR
ncbi:hypothetical protein DV532_01805 [Pseudomonas sp. Leaf58]|uniref:hypothetical protein n=1 Tax=Pseudomonas sp. Leaf58 TaxID=1736226 RepID=UPI0006FB2158|nr:hypothetical protein [Pseudomonas sp. Leaf58]AYG43116.1 hypothetical protein DV532_01805 [Pseudomonas sp. Leaf58]KQN58342.1 hypothetical protein ASF02_23615 [Pseudomonas sp. Leaf58]